MKRRRAAFAGVLFGVVLVTAFVAGQKTEQAEVFLKAAAQKQLVDGDLGAAIALYKKVAALPGADRASVATALVQMGRCYEKLGDAQSLEARNAYERVLKEFSDQNEAARQARSRLAALTRPLEAASASMLARRIWADALDVTGAPSPDGRYLTFVDWETGDLAVHDLASGENRRLTHKGPWTDSNEQALYSKVSPDGRQVVYSWYNEDNRYDLHVVGIDGSNPRTLHRDEAFAYEEPQDWSADGKWIVARFERFNGSYELALVGVPDGSVKILKKFDASYPTKLSFSPDGRYIAYDLVPNEDSANRDIFVLKADGSRDVPVVQHSADDFLLGWTPDGSRILFASDRTGTIGAWWLRVVDGRPAGQPELVKPDIGRIWPMGFTRKGSFYYSLAPGTTDLYAATIDVATGKVVTAPVRATERFLGATSSPDWSPDGRYLAYLSVRSPVSLAPRGRMIVVRNTETGAERELSPDFSALSLRWCADGRSLLVGGRDSRDRFAIYRVDAQTGAASSLLDAGSGFQATYYIAAPQPTPDGKTIVYQRNDFKERLSRLIARDLETGQDREVFRGPEGSWIAAPLGGALSPDGQWVAFSYLDAPTKTFVVRAAPVAGGAVREVVRFRPSEDATPTSLAWSRDGRYILFTRRASADPKALKTALWKVSIEGGQPEPLGLEADNIRGLRVHPDGRRVVFTAGQAKMEVWALENFLPAANGGKQ